MPLEGGSEGEDKRSNFENVDEKEDLQGTATNENEEEIKESYQDAEEDLERLETDENRVEDEEP